MSHDSNEPDLFSESQTNESESNQNGTGFQNWVWGSWHQQRTERRAPLLSSKPDCDADSIKQASKEKECSSSRSDWTDPAWPATKQHCHPACDSQMNQQSTEEIYHWWSMQTCVRQMDQAIESHFISLGLKVTICLISKHPNWTKMPLKSNQFLVFFFFL